MKYKAVLAILVALFFFLEPLQTAKAYSEPQNIELEEKIKALEDEIQHLELLVSALLSLQKQVSSESYFVIDISDDSVIAEKKSGIAYPIASITKLMSAVAVFENISMDETITLTPKMLKPHGYSPSIFLNLTISANDLLKESLIQSVNDAAESLSYFLGKEKFIGIMNKKAKDIGMKNTRFYDATGLNPKNKSTASDIAKLLAYIHKNHPEILFNKLKTPLVFVLRILVAVLFK